MYVSNMVIDTLELDKKYKDENEIAGFWKISDLPYLNDLAAERGLTLWVTIKLYKSTASVGSWLQVWRTTPVGSRQDVLRPDHWPQCKGQIYHAWIGAEPSEESCEF